jgi:phytoene desaturase
MQKIFMMHHSGQKSLCFTLISLLTDKTAAPEGMESGFFLFRWHLELMTRELREEYFNKIIDRFEHLTQQSVKNNIIFKVSFCKDDFVKDYNSYKGNAYGMANTLLQTAFLRPKLKAKK